MLYFNILCYCFQNMLSPQIATFVVCRSVNYICIAYCLYYICNTLRNVSHWFYCTAPLYWHDIWKILAIEKKLQFSLQNRNFALYLHSQSGNMAP